MKWFNDIKIRSKLFLMFGILVCVMTGFAIFTATQTYGINNQTIELINSFQARQIYITDAISYSHCARDANLFKGHLPLDGFQLQGVVSGFLETCENDAGAFAKNMAGFREIVQSAPGFTEAERRQRLVIIDEIEDSHSRYMETVGRLETLAESADRPEIIQAYEEVISSGLELGGKLERLRDLVFFTAKEKIGETMGLTFGLVKGIIAITAVFVFISILVVLFTVKIIQKPIVKLENAVTKIKDGDMYYPVRSGRGDEFGVLSNRIGDMVDKIIDQNKTTTIMDNLDLMICVSDFDYNLLFINKHLAETYGIDREKAIKQKCYKALKNRETPCSYCTLPELFPEKDSFPSKKLDYIWNGGLKAWLTGTGSIIRWVDGSLAHLLCTRDVTRMKQQEELVERQAAELKLQTAKLHGVFNAISDVLFVKDMDSRFVLCNKAMENFYNCRTEDIIGKNEIDGLGFTVEEAERIFECEKKVFSKGIQVKIEETLNTSKGIRVFDTVKVPLEQNGSIIGLVSVVRDITDNKEKKKQMDLAHWYKSILDATPFPITVTDADMKWTFVNKAVEDFLGKKREDLLGKPCSNWNSDICNTPNCGIACVKRGIKRTFFTYEGVSYQVNVAGFIEIVQDVTKLVTELTNG